MRRGFSQSLLLIDTTLRLMSVPKSKVIAMIKGHSNRFLVFQPSIIKMPKKDGRIGHLRMKDDLDSS